MSIISLIRTVSKKCCKCKVEKDASDFNKKKSTVDGLQGICRSCSKERAKKQYSENRESQLKNILKAKKERQQKLRKYVYDYLMANPCVQCGEDDPIVLELDHLREKEFAISHGVARCISINRIKNEISKCQVLCSNCHKRKIVKDLGWYSYPIKVGRKGFEPST